MWSSKPCSRANPFSSKLHSPRDFIVGGAFFAHHSILPVSLAWSAFGRKNGADTEEEMRTRIEKYRKTAPDRHADYAIGCILLESPFFFGEDDWIPVPEWRKQIVRGRGYDTAVEPGKTIWDRVQAILASERVDLAEESVMSNSERRFGTPQILLPRLGQGSFRILITDTYKRRCAVTGSKVLYVLDAAHIRPYKQGGRHSPSNGILLRRDLHTLLDRGYITVTPDYRVEVSRRIKEEFHNGKDYYAMHGSQLALPDKEVFRPDPRF